MHPQGPNPTKVQSRPLKGQRKSSVPLVLIHDGGGTTFGFWMLGSLYRDVWAVHNPQFWSGKPWEGGIDEMARHYIDLLRATGIHGTIILGGWSLGGYISMAMARLLAEEDDRDGARITVAGLLLIDSPYHIPWAVAGANGDARPDGRRRQQQHSQPSMDGLPPLVAKAFEQCEAMLRSWALPAWPRPACQGEDVEMTAGGRRHRVRCGTILYKPNGADWTTVDRPVHPRPPAPAEPRGCAPPPGVILRCTKRKESADGPDRPCRIDEFRDDCLLGWEKGYASLFKAAMEIDSDHYGVFDKYDRKHVSAGRRCYQEYLICAWG